MEEATENEHLNTLAPVPAQADYSLPAWRLREVMSIAIKKLCDAEYYAEGFDCIKMIAEEGIALEGYSDFLPENLERMRAISKGIWKEGLCLIIPAGVRMICYNDRQNDDETKLIIILHEYGHIVQRHTEQSMNREMEASCFATVMFLLLAVEKKVHLAKTIAEQGAIAEFARLLTWNKKGGTMEDSVC